jgi:hypothetical protein
MLANHTSGAQVPNQQLEQVGLRRVLSNVFRMKINPDIGSRRAWSPVNRSDYREVGLVVVVNPLNEKADEIIGAQRCSAGVHQKILDQTTFFVGVSLIPRSERSSDKRQVLVAFDPLSNLVTKRLQSVDDLNQRPR